MIGDGDGERWRALALRLTVPTLPAQLVGALLGFLPTLLLGRQAPTADWAPALVLVGAGAVAGWAVGRWAEPPRPGRGVALALVAAFGAVSFLIITTVAQLGVRAVATPAAPLTWVVGTLVVVVLQTVVATVCWRRRVG